MSIETAGTFNPGIRNPQSGSTATGLIQFIESTARSLGTTTAKLANLTNVGQMAYVVRYFQRFGPTRARLVDMRPVDTYLVVFAPGFVGKPMSSTIYAAPAKTYELNKGFDPPPRKGRVEVADVSRVLERKLEAARTRAPLVVEVWPEWAGVGLVALSLTAVGVGGVVAHAFPR